MSLQDDSVSPDEFSEPTSDQLRTLPVLIDILRRLGIIDIPQILTETRLDNTVFSNFMRGRSGVYYANFAGCISNKIKNRIGSIQEIYHPIIHTCFPKLVKIKEKARETISPNDIFLPYARRDAESQQDVARTYGGVFEIYRYSSHIERKPEKIEVSSHPEGKIDLIDDPWMIHSVMQVNPATERNSFATFDLYYRPTNRGEKGAISKIRGIILPIRAMVYFLGLEEHRYPLIMMTTQKFEEKIQLFVGMIMRYHEYRRTITSRVGFRRILDESKGINDLTGGIGLVTESRIREIIEEFDKGLLNHVEYGGRAALLALD